LPTKTQDKDTDDKDTTSGTTRSTVTTTGSAPPPDEQPQEAPDSEQEPPATKATIRIEDHQIDVDIKDPGRSDRSLTDEEGFAALNRDELMRVQRAVIAEQAARNTQGDRPFAEFDTESLLVLRNQISGELASR
jgi:hypothetical protein